MNWYEHHIKDYDSATAHLSWDEDMAYTRMLRWYYRQERPLPPDLVDVCRLVRAATDLQRQAVEQVLREFFVLQADGYHQGRADEVLAAYQAGEPERQAKKVNEATRLSKHREERRELFERLNAAGKHLRWNTPIEELRASVGALGPATPETLQAVAGAAEGPETPKNTGSGAVDHATKLRASAPMTPKKGQKQAENGPEKAPATPPETPLPHRENGPATQPATGTATLATATQPPLPIPQPPPTNLLEGVQGELSDPRPRPSRRCPKTWNPSEKLLAWARHEHPGVELEHELAKFRDNTFRTPRSDWDATFRNWIREASDRWKARNGQRVAGAPATAGAREAARKAARVAEMTGGLLREAAPPPVSGDIIDMEPTHGTPRRLG
ncbi:MAG: YdaU family protein [Inhella sp.]|nr:YdaU family protein [Inhella sp.]